MFIGLKTKTHHLVYYTQKTVTTHPVLFSKYYFHAPATQAINFQERKYWVLTVIVKKSFLSWLNLSSKIWTLSLEVCNTALKFPDVKLYKYTLFTDVACLYCISLPTIKPGRCNWHDFTVFVGEGRVKRSNSGWVFERWEKKSKHNEIFFFRLAPSVATYSPFSVRSFMSPSNGTITGKSLGMTVRLSTPPIHRLPFRLTGPAGNPGSILKSRSSSFTLLLKHKHKC